MARKLFYCEEEEFWALKLKLQVFIIVQQPLICQKIQENLITNVIRPIKHLQVANALYEWMNEAFIHKI